MFLVPVAVSAMAGGAFFASEVADPLSLRGGRRLLRAPRSSAVLRSRTMRLFVIAAALLPALSHTPASASEKIKGKLGKAGVEVSVTARGNGNQVLVRRNGREFAKYTSPQGAASVLLCCTYNQCEPIGPTGFQICDIVVWCPDIHGGCSPQ